MKKAGTTFYGLTAMIADRIEGMSIDEILRGLIAESDLTEVACCLDFIAKESGHSIKMFKGDEQTYPAQRRPKILRPAKVGSITRAQAKAAVKKVTEERASKAAYKVLHGKGSSKAAKTRRGSALTQR